jgi:nitrilase
MGLWVAAGQLCSTENVADNLNRSRAVVKAAATAGAKLVGLPENFAYLGSDRDHKVALAEPVDDAADGPILTAMRETARQDRGLAAAWAASREGSPSPERIGNTSLLLDPDGAIRARYRRCTSSTSTSPAASASASPTRSCRATRWWWPRPPWGGLGLTICYDLRFPELYRQLGARARG